MITEVVSMTLSFLLMYHGRDKVWTPTFQGARASRFGQAVVHYQEKMGIREDYIVVVSPVRATINGEPSCAWARKLAGWHLDEIGFSTDRSCDRWKPEYLAMHEQCHRRYAHLDLDGMTGDEKHREVRECMALYSARERR